MCIYKKKISNYVLKHIDIELNHRCNLGCRHCSARAVKGRSTNELTIKDIKDILSEAKQLGLSKVGLTGGEPLYNVSKFESLARFCVDILNLSVHTHTNGTLVTKEMCKPDGVLTLFESISITFLAGDADTHDQITKIKGSFKKSFMGASIIAEAGLPLTCYYIPMHGTCKGYNELTPQLKDIGVTRIRAMALAPSGRARPIYEQTTPATDEIQQFEKDLIDARDKLGIHIEAGYCTRLSMPRLAALNGHEKCMSGINRVHINSKGDVFPCTAASGVKELNLGNLKNNGTRLKDIWYFSNTIKIIRKIHNGGISSCDKCSRNPKCRTGCTVNACGTMSEETRLICPVINASI
jgi:AdoMet-dependent heme synthase